jgi:hypothetical protein
MSNKRGRDVYTIIDDVTFTIVCKSEQDDQAYNYPETDTNTPSCNIQAQYIDHNTKYGTNCNPDQTLNSRDMICFESNKIGGYLYAYRSSSELGIWRLAYTRDGDCGLFKGELDYVQGTLIHHKLIAFINTKWSTIQSATDYISGLLTTGKPTPCYAWRDNKANGPFCLTPPFITGGEIAMIDHNERCAAGDIDPFKLLEITCSNRDTTPLSDIWKALIGFGRYLQTSTEPPSPTQGFKLGDSEDINTYDFNETYAGITATINIRSVPLYNDSITYVLIYCVYTASYKSNTVSGYKYTVSGSYGIALLPSNFSVNNYGIYTCYKQAKMFICKPFFYRSMCSIDDANKPELQCPKLYLYAGFIFDCWPYNALATFRYSDRLGEQIDHLKTHISKPTVQDLYNSYTTSPGTTLNALARSLTAIVPRLLQGGKKRKSQKKRKTHKKRKSQKRRKTTYSIFRSNK